MHGRIGVGLGAGADGAVTGDIDPRACAEATPRVGVGVLVLREGRVLLGLRQGSHGAGTWAPPGGHLEFGEDVDDCARREVAEETGLVIEAVKSGPYVSDVFEAERRHYVTLFVVASHASGEPERLEPGACLRWAWFAWDALPDPLFAPLRTLLDTGYVPDDAVG